MVLNFYSTRIDIHTPEDYQKLLNGGFTKGYDNVCIKPSAVWNVFDVVGHVTYVNPLRDGATYRFEDWNGHFTHVNFTLRHVDSDVTNLGENRLSFLPGLWNINYHSVKVDTLTSNDVGYLAKLRSSVFVKVDNRPSKDVCQQVLEVNLERGPSLQISVVIGPHNYVVC